jgi:hypothetical protein
MEFFHERILAQLTKLGNGFRMNFDCFNGVYDETA